MLRRLASVSLGGVIGTSIFGLIACDSDDGGPQPGPDTAIFDSTFAEGGDATSDAAESGPDTRPVPSTPIIGTITSTRVETQRLMFAAGEMQISGEPFAEGFMGRNLDGYDRSFLPPDRYSPSAKGGDEIVDIVGFSTAVESYEYSKFHVNMIALQTYAGPSLAWGPVLNAAGDTATDEPTVRARLAGRMDTILRHAGADVAGFAILPPPSTNPFNPLGFSGIHPILVPYRSFDPALVPDVLVGSCTFVGGYATFSKATRIPDYECGYTSLAPEDRITNPTRALEMTIVPGAIGMATWKEALWGIDFAGRVHDAKGNMVETVAPADEPNVGMPGNTVTGKDDTGAATEVGTYLGSIPLEGMWGLTYLEEMDNAAQFLLSKLTTGDGTTYGGFATVKDAIEYDYSSAPKWFPAKTTVVEGAPAEWPSPQLTVGDGKSSAEDLAALLLGNAMFFGMTDARNEAIGGKIGLRLAFDGVPFAKDDGAPNGEATAHDRALGLLRVAFIDLDRLHTLPGTSIITDEATPNAAADAAHGRTVTTTTMAHVLIGLRQTLLSLNAAITQYGGADPSPKLDDKGILNTVAIHPPGGDVSFSARVRAVLTKQAEFVRDVVTTDDGSVTNSVTFDAAGKPVRDAGKVTLEAQTAAIRALLEGFLATGDTAYVARARKVYQKLDALFYVPAAKFWRGVEGGADTVAMNAERFAFLQSALREMHKIAKVDGDPLLSRDALEQRIGRLNKLFLNGWDDANDDKTVDKGTECLAGRLQMGEQALTGEYGRNDKGDLVADRDDDCVLNISWSKTASLLAGEVTFSVKK
jgi:hypothetical protein